MNSVDQIIREMTNNLLSPAYPCVHVHTATAEFKSPVPRAVSSGGPFPMLAIGETVGAHAVTYVLAMILVLMIDLDSELSCIFK